MFGDNEPLEDNGPLYSVVDVAGRAPVDLDDLIGAITVTIEKKGYKYSLVGVGEKHDHIVFFYQKDAGSADEYSPVWMITDHGDGRMTAQPSAPE